ncbi:MAG: alkaline phosphatase family protein [Anaerolineae bacterium]|nr:alkaline phosphatase family protein [Anaerolineae bacterium]
MTTSNRVLIIGLDSANWDVLGPWIDEGALPNLARLRQQGSWGNLRSSLPPITAAAWSTFMTGKRPGKHGVYHFIKLFEEPASDQAKPELVNARAFKSSTLWDILGHNDRKVGLVNVPMTFPPRPVNGFMVSGFLAPKNSPYLTYPLELANELKDYVIDLDRFIDKKPYEGRYDAKAKRTANETSPSLGLMQEFQTMLENRALNTLTLMEKPWDTFMVVFMGPDRMGHYLWPYHRSPDPNDPPETQQLCQAVKDYYVRLDKIVGQLIEKAGGDTNTIIMSDHGMGVKPAKRLHGNFWLQSNGWLVPKKSGGNGVNKPVGLLSQLRLPRDKIGRIVYRIPGLAKSSLVKVAGASRAAAVDTDTSQAYCIPMYNNVFGIRINNKGEAREALRNEITAALTKIVDPETNKPIVEEVVRGEDYYYGPHATNTPDMVVVLYPEYGCNHHLGHYSAPVTRLQVTPTGGDHRMNGILVAIGPDLKINPGPLPNLSIEDIAPTILYLMRLPVPEDLDGRVLTEIISNKFQAANPVQRCAPLGVWPSAAEAKFVDEGMSEDEEAEIRDRLQALGYIE